MNFYKKAAELLENGRTAAFCTVIDTKGSTPRHSGSKMIVYPDGTIEGSVGGGEVEQRVIVQAQASMRDGKNRKVHYDMVDPARGDPGVCGGQVEVFIEPVLGAPTLIVVGGGHVGRAVAHLGKWIGFRVIVSDDRP